MVLVYSVGRITGNDFTTTIESNMMELYKGNCLEVMKTIESGSIDAIITDIPYGTTSCKWDSVIDIKLMWAQLNRIIKPTGAIVLFAQQPFSSLLLVSNVKKFRHRFLWEKDKCANFMVAKAQPLKYTEDILVFCNVGFLKNQFGKPTGTYNPQMRKGKGNDRDLKRVVDKSKNLDDINKRENPTKLKLANNSAKQRFPKDILSITTQHKRVHPTQKPIELMEYLIKTYTNENETVLDFTMGSGSTGVAAKNTNRNFIGIEMDENYFNIACERINNTNYRLF
jgi:site-specific DNA-methyltransferase (adenine-specific)